MARRPPVPVGGIDGTRAGRVGRDGATGGEATPSRLIISGRRGLHHYVLLDLARRILRDQDRTDDAVQECLVRAWRELRGLRDPDRWEAWLFRLLINACRDEGRRVRRRGAEIRVLPLDRPAPGDQARDLADRDELERGFRRLTIDQRSVLVMHHYLGMRSTEIAETLGIPVGTVHSRLHHATNALRAVLEADARPPKVAGGRSA
ncbi:MAG: RNA polymerase sigma factor [Chloroflexota bacterium]